MRGLRFSVLLTLFGLAAVSLASAGLNQTLTISVDTQCPPATCTFDTGIEGSPASGSGDFNPIGIPWSYSFLTGNALSWCSDPCGVYEATFGYGGSFAMSGPDGLTFTGVITGGAASVSGDMSGVVVDFFGQWSNGLYGYGDVSTGTDPPFDILFEQFDTHIAPEPSSFVLLASGVAGLWAVGRRKFRR